MTMTMWILKLRDPFECWVVTLNMGISWGWTTCRIYDGLYREAAGAFTIGVVLTVCAIATFRWAERQALREGSRRVAEMRRADGVSQNPKEKA